ncbi:MAG: DNA-binding domain-containing protein [Undibacterium sp.]|nr:DNA-binding domain-containing protein [Undibacterium sp.]
MNKVTCLTSTAHEELNRPGVADSESYRLPASCLSPNSEVIAELVSAPSTQPDLTSLEKTQQWMLMAITNIHGLPAGLEQAQQQSGWCISDVILPGLDPAPRRGLEIYAQAYWLRLLSCLASDYPALRRHLGPELFDFFCRAYLNEFPSRAYSLYELGNQFTRFLRRSQRAASKAGNDLWFPLELAELEYARNSVLRAPIAERAGTAKAAISSLSVAQQCSDYSQLLIDAAMQLSLPVSLRLRMTRHPLSAFQAWLEGGESAFPVQKTIGYLAVVRQRFTVRYYNLSDWQFFTLAVARRTPRSLPYCARAAARRCHRPASEILAQLMLWIPAAQSVGLLQLSPIGGTGLNPDVDMDTSRSLSFFDAMINK